MSVNAKKPRLSMIPAVAITLLGSYLALSQASQAAAQSPAENSASPATTVPDISDQKLKAAATAIPQVEGIRQNYEQQIAQAPDAEKPRLQNQAGAEMIKAIADQGLSIPEYNSILETAEQNPEIKARLIQEMPDPDQSHGQDEPESEPLGP